MELLVERAGPSLGGPVISFGAPPDDQMSIVTSESESSGDEDSAALLPLGRVALPEPDPELMAMLFRAAERVGLEWRPPLCPSEGWMIGFWFSASCPSAILPQRA